MIIKRQSILTISGDHEQQDGGYSMESDLANMSREV